MKRIIDGIILAAALFGLCAHADAAADTRHGTVLTEHLASTVLRENRIGLETKRLVKVYLPPGYAASGRSYPVVYYFHSLGWSAEKMFEDGNLVNLLERGFADGVVREFIFVAADFTTPVMGSLFENSPTSGRWLDFVADELVPFIDGKFRTIRHRNSRGLAGDFMGGRGALKLAMVKAELFSVVYALHPVATGSGSSPWTMLSIDWKRIHAAKSFADLEGPGRDKIFTAICQGFLPNAERPPFYCDFAVELENEEPKVNVANLRKAQAAFHLDETLDAAAANLRSMRGIAFDWGRFDPTPAHVESNRNFSRMLENLGIAHTGEEYNGGPWEKNWTPNGRFYARLLPFFAEHLTFEE